MLQAAEDCFGEHGIDAVSLRQIAIAAGQGNTAAVQYHFGSKEGLLEAIFQHRLPAIDPRRKALIETLDPQQRTQVRSLLTDPKSVALGKSVSVRVNIGGRR